MQQITPEAEAAIEAGAQTVVPRVIAEWQNSSAIQNVQALASSDDYFNKTLGLDPDAYLRVDFNALYSDVVSDAPISYWPLDTTSGTTATDAMGLNNGTYVGGYRLGQTGQPVEFFLTPGSHSDTTGLQWFDFDLPTGSTVYGDKAYNVYALEESLRDVGIHLLPMRKENSKRPAPAWLCYLQAHYRKMIETTGSLIERLLPKSIHAVTALGFELKIALFVVACSLNQL